MEIKEIYNGYLHGGNFMWISVPNTYSEVIQFTSKGQYFENIDSKEVQRQCAGTYKLLPDSILQIESSCQTVLIHDKIELNQETLIINTQVIEGVIRKKYTLANPE